MKEEPFKCGAFDTDWDITKPFVQNYDVVEGKDFSKEKAGFLGYRFHAHNKNAEECLCEFLGCD
jgi:hypothetical protein